MVTVTYSITFTYRIEGIGRRTALSGSITLESRQDQLRCLPHNVKGHAPNFSHPALAI